MKKHYYKVTVEWDNKSGSGTHSYASYDRNHIIDAEGKLHQIFGSSDPAFRGGSERYNPEELFLSAVSSCHMLWYLHLCSAHQIVVTAYSDQPEGIMQEDKDGSGKFTEIILHPQVSIEDQQHLHLAKELHGKAGKMCFIANSCNFTIEYQPLISCNEE